MRIKANNAQGFFELFEGGCSMPPTRDQEQEEAECKGAVTSARH